MQQDRFDDDTRIDSMRDANTERDVTPRLVHLDDMSDLQVADGDPDIRGWDVRTADGEKIGKVKDLIVDTGLMKVRYIEAQIDKEVLNASDDRHVLIPIGSARLDDDEDDVYLSSSIVDPRTLPPYDRNALSREYEVSLRDRFPRTGSVGTNPASTSSQTLADRRSDDEDFYRDDLYDDQRFFGQRRRGRESSNYIGPSSDDVIRRRNEGL
jgi:photosynthetic reaction center H subunit